MGSKIPNVHVRSTIPDEVMEKFKIPPELSTPQAFIDKCLTDTLFFEVFVMRHGKKKEYRDFNAIHAQAINWLNFSINPIRQKLLLMCRNSLKSTIGRGFFIQEFLKLCYFETEALLGLVTGLADLAGEHLQIVGREILSNPLIQAFFGDFVPRQEKDAESWNDDKIRWKKIGVDIGSTKKTLSGRHYGGIWNDNLMNEVNARTPDLRKSIVDLWRAQEPLLTDDAWELVSETPWEADDVSGHILDPEDLNFDYRSIFRKSPAIFVTESGYGIFSCFARNEKGEPNFPEIISEEYLRRKRAKQGEYLYQRMYEGQIVSSEERLFVRSDILHYDVLPENTFRNIAVDCSGTEGRESTPTGVTIGDWDEDAVLHVSYAKKEKVDPMTMFKWVTKLWDDSIAESRIPLWMIIENEKYGIFLKSLIENDRPDIRVRTVNLKGVPQPVRVETLKQYYQSGKIKSRKGLHDYEAELLAYKRGKAKSRQVDTALLDTIFLHWDNKYVPKKRPRLTSADVIEDDFRKQIEKDRRAAHETPLKAFVEARF